MRVLAAAIVLWASSSAAFAQATRPAGGLFEDGFILSFVYQKNPGFVVMRLSKRLGNDFENWECDLELSVIDSSGLATIRPAYDALCTRFIVTKP